ncbi:hypothetical protein HZB07_05690 [Candidatus Saganbacteria bacterium]|nr:hypothetical protein [Candidatus Saganbacteria bacterium]
MKKKKKKYFGLYPRDEDKFAGEYLAVISNRILAHGKQLKKVIETAQKLAKEPLLIKVPTVGWKQSMILWLNISLKAKK